MTCQTDSAYCDPICHGTITGQMAVRRAWRVQRRRQRRPTAASNKLWNMRHRAGVQLRAVAAAMRVHPRTARRWEIGETRPSKEEWARLVAYFSGFAPRDAAELAAAAGVVPSTPAVVPADMRAIADAIIRAADDLDVAPRRVRAALREIARAVVEARGSIADLAKAAEDPVVV